MRYCICKNSDTLISVKANPSGKQIIFTIVLYLVVGLGSGFVGGLLGVGGGIIIVPVLFLLFSQSGQYPSELVLLVAVATSLACIVFTSASAAYAQIKGRRVLWSVVKRLLPTGAGGQHIGRLPCAHAAA
jgi:uncharacterized membrane protein YfcA